ncbi:tetratricopeptide repeat domain 7 isoform X2 [Oratosquilla oratoria]|uniref:tetratricopeptide repeat domain 7 isoform X2 n=1 Tax=Oratosquilla oratoria TaxID=337810 RepID=UPI003F76B7C6
MSGKSGRGNRIEADIEKSREEANWRKVIELAEQLKTRNASGVEILANFLIGEGKLELYLEENPPTEANIPKAKNGLSDARHHLLNCTGEHSKKVSLDALLLLGKLEYALGDYEGSLARLHAAGLDQLTEKALPTRSLRIVAESYAVKALCLEKSPLPHSSKYQQAERDEKMIKCFELAGDLTLLYLQEQDKLTSTSSSHSLPSISTPNTTGSSSPLPPNGGENKKIGVILETALQRAPILHMKAGDVDKAIARYRSMLSAVESISTQHLRLTLARQLAEVLLRGCSEHSYKSPSKDERSKSSSSLKTGESPWKPRKYMGINLFLPKNINEEVILLLLISEAMAVREAVLSQSPEFKNARVHAFDNATAVYDLLCIALSRRKQFKILHEVFERAMKFSFEETHVWQQFGLALTSGMHSSRAVLVLREVNRLLPNEPHYCLLAAKVYFQRLNKIEEGLEWVAKALKCAEEKSNSAFISRCLVYQGIGLMLKAHHTQRRQDHQMLRSKAFDAFLKAQQLDPSDHLAEYYLGLHYAQSCQLAEATHHVKMAIYLRSEHSHALHLLILILSAQKEFEEALELAEAAIQEYPENLHLMYVKASLEEVVHGPDVALLTAKKMLVLWQQLYKDHMMSDVSDAQSQYMNHDSYSVFNLSDKDTVSVRAESVEASRVEQALSEVASSLSSYQPRPGPHQAWLMQIQIWLLTAQLYLKTDHVNEASQCIQEASSIFPMSHHIMFMRGLLHEKKNEFHDAQVCYQNSLAVNPYHSKSLRHLGLVYHYLGMERLAEKTLLDAIKMDALDYESWSGLGEVMSSLGQLDAAAKCLATAIDIEAKSSVLPFSSIPQCFE